MPFGRTIVSVGSLDDFTSQKSLFLFSLVNKMLLKMDVVNNVFLLQIIMVPIQPSHHCCSPHATPRHQEGHGVVSMLY